MRFKTSVFLAAAVSATGCSTTPPKTIQSEVALPVATRYSCLACHSVNKKIVGPSFKEVAARYRGQDAQKHLFSKVRSGGSGTWGTIPEPPMRQIPEEDLKMLIQWITEM
jgi:cytochrome c